VSAPEFSGVNYVTGLGFAIHLMYGYSVVASNIVCDWETGRYKATVDIEMTDHFGLDYGDVDKFGTTEKVRNKAHQGDSALLTTGGLLGFAGGSLFVATDKAKSDKLKSGFFFGFAVGSVVLSVCMLISGGIVKAGINSVASGFGRGLFFSIITVAVPSLR
jgi:hypothetical protein